jgi:hypothetical protein
LACRDLASSNRVRGLLSGAGPQREPAFPPVRAMWWACQDLNLGPHPYQQSTGNRCAAVRFPRLCSTVGAEVKCSNDLQLSALPTRRNRADIVLITAAPQQYAMPLHRYRPAHTPPPGYLSLPLPPPSALPHQPDPAPPHLSFVSLPSPRTIQIQHTRAPPNFERDSTIAWFDAGHIVATSAYWSRPAAFTPWAGVVTDAVAHRRAQGCSRCRRRAAAGCG